MRKFSELSASDARGLINTPEHFQENEDFYNGEHWRDGEGFADTIPPPASLASQTIKKGIARIFVSENIIREIVKRRTDGVMARTPKWEFIRAEPGTESSEARQEIQDDEISIPMRKWWNTREIHNLMKEAIRISSLHGCAVLRIYIPPALLPEASGGAVSVRFSSIEEALDLIYIEVVAPDRAVVHTDPYSMQQVGAVHFESPSFTDVVSRETAEGIFEDSFGDFAELTYLDDGETVHAIVFDAGERKQVEYDLRGRLLMYCTKNALLVTEQIRQLQRTINTTLTHMAFNNRETNFQQRVFFNGQPPGSVVKDPDTGEDRFVVEVVERGANRDLWVKGLETEDSEGSVRLESPSMEVIDPSDPNGYIRSIAEYRRGLYREAKQLHIELIKDATSTGEARLQAIADFVQDLLDMKEVADPIGRWVLETVYALAQNLAGRPVHRDVKADFSTVINVGPIPQEVRRVIVEEVKAGLKSRFTAMTEIGIEEPETEMQRIRDDISYRLELLKLKVEIYDSLLASGIGEEAARIMAGFTDEEREQLADQEEQIEPAEFASNGRGSQAGG